MVKQRRSGTIYPRAVAQRPLPSLAESLAAAVATTSCHRHGASTAADRHLFHPSFADVIPYGGIVQVPPL